MTSFTTSIEASVAKVWEHLLHKIEHPEAFVPGVSEVFILEKKDDFVIRQMTITMDGVASKVVEKITSSPYTVRFELLEHPEFSGFVDNQAMAISENKTQLTFTMNWVSKHTKLVFDNPEIMKKAVLKTKNHIETNL